MIKGSEFMHFKNGKAKILTTKSNIYYVRCENGIISLLRDRKVIHTFTQESMSFFRTDEEAVIKYPFLRLNVME